MWFLKLLWYKDTLYSNCKEYVEYRYCHLNSYNMCEGIFGCEVEYFKAIWPRNNGQDDLLNHLLNCPLLNHYLFIYLIIFECELKLYVSPPKELFLRGSAPDTYLYFHAMLGMVWINK